MIGMSFEDTVKYTDTLCGKNANNINALYKLLTRSTGVDEMIAKYTGVDYDVNYNFDKFFENLYEKCEVQDKKYEVTHMPEICACLDHNSHNPLMVFISNDSLNHGCKIISYQPGINSKNTEIVIEGDKMNIDAQITNYYDGKEFKKSATLTLSNKLNLKRIEANCKDGILTIFIPIKKVNKIKVEIN